MSIAWFFHQSFDPEMFDIWMLPDIVRDFVHPPPCTLSKRVSPWQTGWEDKQPWKYVSYNFIYCKLSFYCKSLLYLWHFFWCHFSCIFFSFSFFFFIFFRSFFLYSSYFSFFHRFLFKVDATMITCSLKVVFELKLMIMLNIAQ